MVVKKMNLILKVQSWNRKKCLIKTHQLLLLLINIVAFNTIN